MVTLGDKTYSVVPLDSEKYEYYLMLITAWAKRDCDSLSTFRSKLLDWTQEDRNTAIQAFMSRPNWDEPDFQSIEAAKYSLAGVRLLATLVLLPKVTLDEIESLITEDNKVDIYTQIDQDVKKLRKVENSKSANITATFTEQSSHPMCMQVGERQVALLDRCLAGEVAAWEDLYAKCKEPLCTVIRGILPHGYPNSGGEVVDEIASRVWYALVKNDGEILGKLTAFMRDLVTPPIQTN